MLLSSSVIIQPAGTTEQHTTSYAQSAAALAALVLAVYAAKKTKKQLRKLKRKLMFSYVKETLRSKFNKIKGLFSKKAAPISDRTLLYILLGIIVLILIFIEPIVAIAVLLLGILLILLLK